MSLLVPTNCRTFLQYAEKLFNQEVNIQKTDVVRDRHFQDTLKSETRNN